MSRWKYPAVAAGEAARLRKGKRKDVLILLGVVLLMVAGFGAYLFFLHYQFRMHEHRHHHHHHHSDGTK